MELIKINNVEITGKPRKVVVDFEFFDSVSETLIIELVKNHKYANGTCDVVKIDKTIIDIGLAETNAISIKRRGKFNSDDKINILLLDVMKYGWKPILLGNKIYLKYKKSPFSLNWKRDNKELREFLMGLISIAKNRELFSKNSSFNNEEELRAELWHLCKEVTEKMKIKKLSFKIQYPIGRKFADFLIKKSGKPFVIIECKVGDHKKGIYQAKNYSKKLNVKYYGVCTENGIFMIKPKKKFNFNETGIEKFVKFIDKI